MKNRFSFVNTYDLDGVLVDTSHRYRNKPDGTIDLEYWFANMTPEKIMQDALLPMAWDYMRDLRNSNIFVIICTSRMFTSADVNMIQKKLGHPDLLLMRPPSDNVFLPDGTVQVKTPDAELKFQQLSKYFAMPIFQNTYRKFFEDNPRNLERCKSLFNETVLIESQICPAKESA